MTESMASTDERGIRNLWPWAILAASVLGLVALSWMHRDAIDDAFINYRVVEQIRSGNGPVFNVGERVEVFTSPAWIALLWLGDVVLPVKIEWIAMFGGIFLGAFGVVSATLGSRLLLTDDEHGRSAAWFPLGAMVFIALPATWRLLASGLENGLSLAWLGASMWVLGRWASGQRRLSLGGAAVLGFGVLVRPDLAPCSLLFLVAVFCGERDATIRRRLALLFAAGVLPLAYQVLRMGYYGVLLPNTAIAKSASGSRWDLGWWYLQVSFGRYWFWVPVLLLVLLGYRPLLAGLGRSTGSDDADVPKRTGLVAGAFLLGAALCTIYFVRVGGDYIPTRLLFPAAFAFVCPVASIRLPHPRSWTTTSGISVSIVWIIASTLFLRIPQLDGTDHKPVTLQDYAAYVRLSSPRNLEPGRVYSAATAVFPKGTMGMTPIIVLSGIGVTGYALPTRAYVFDQLGLAQPMASHLVLRRRTLPGHEKYLPYPWTVALTDASRTPNDDSMFPKIGGALTVYGRRIIVGPQDDPQGKPFPKRVETARRVLSCRAVRDFRSSYTGPISWHRFGANLIHAWRNTRFRLPGEPSQAAVALCTSAERAAINP